MDSRYDLVIKQIEDLTTMANTLLRDAERMFAADLRDPRLNVPGGGHEQFIARVNAIGLKLMNQRDYCLAI